MPPPQLACGGWPARGKCDRRRWTSFARRMAWISGSKTELPLLPAAAAASAKRAPRNCWPKARCVVLVSKIPEINAAAVREFGKLFPDRALGIADRRHMTMPPSAPMTAQVMKTLGRIDILVNSAATVIPQDFFKMDDGDLSSLLEQKFNPAARCIRHAVPHMRQTQMGPHHQYLRARRAASRIHGRACRAQQFRHAQSDQGARRRTRQGQYLWSMPSCPTSSIPSGKTTPCGNGRK